MDILNVLKTRYSTKEFDSTKKLTEEQLTQLEDLLQLAPSSTNHQPWYFTIATSDEGKNRVAKSTVGAFEFNKAKVLDASAVVIFSSKIDLSDDHLEKVLEQEDTDGRFLQKEFKEQGRKGRKFFANIHKLDYKDFQHWTAKQVYLNLGNFLLGVAALGLDAVAIEGYDAKIIDTEFGLPEKGFSSAVLVAVGYHKDSDFNKTLPKSRLPKKEIIERV